MEKRPKWVEDCSKRVKKSGFEAFQPDGLHAVAEVIEDMTTLDASASREETTDNTGDVTTDVEVLGIINAYTFHAKAESADAWEDYCLPFSQPMLQDVLTSTGLASAGVSSGGR